MDSGILPPVNDWVFKLLFGDERGKTMLIDFLGVFVELPEEEFELTFLDTHLKPEAGAEKLGIVDVKVRTASGKIIEIEIQVNPVTDIGKRLSFYKSKLIVEQIGEGEPYGVIQKVICICIVDYTLFSGETGHLNGFRFCNPENGLCFEDVPEEIYTLELPKAPARDDGTRGWEWIQFLRAKRREEFEMAAERNPEVRKAVDTLYVLSADAGVRAEYERRLKAERDYTSEHEAARKKGREEGREEGARELLRLLSGGRSIEEAKKILGLEP